MANLKRLMVPENKQFFTWNLPLLTPENGSQISCRNYLRKPCKVLHKMENLATNPALQ
jgi:hypothetical protein